MILTAAVDMSACGEGLEGGKRGCRWRRWWKRDLINGQQG